ncbi:hypothetical protein RA307_01320 [Xanthobacteraceae bacterium Astr-EGSB]|uniref:hypothetical protein n=1 Tax=Astrobacterium formosum TaxID=3069710 RepID=UPI0027B2FB32|nr:hypothetical protein [Xanthobacteraceae bacterium Astr-EGSB]
MKKQRRVLEAGIALFDIDCDGTPTSTISYRSTGCAVNLSCRPGIVADELVHVARGQPVRRRDGSVLSQVAVRRHAR